MDRIARTATLLLMLSACGCSAKAPPLTIPETATIPAGWFWMGEDDGRASNGPRHRVYLDEYEIQLTEVTRSEYTRFLAAMEYPARRWDGGDLEKTGDLPATGVLWEEAQAYCRWAGMRLPSEAEWEKAARGEDGRRYPWGNEWDDQKANTAESGVGSVIPVGSYPEGASPYGLLDLCGNAAEWVADVYDPAYYTYAPERNPTGPTLVLDHVLRGGSFEGAYEQATTYYRDSSHSVRPNPRVGFRCARTISPAPAPGASAVKISFPP